MSMMWVQHKHAQTAVHTLGMRSGEGSKGRRLLMCMQYVWISWWRR